MNNTPTPEQVAAAVVLQALTQTQDELSDARRTLQWIITQYHYEDTIQGGCICGDVFPDCAVRRAVRDVVEAR